MTRPYILAETTWKTVDATPYERRDPPLGSDGGAQLPPAVRDRQHPVGAGRERAPRSGRGTAARAVVVLPTVPFGVNTTQLDIKLCLNLNPSTQAALLADLVSALDGQGIHKLLILNGHGGNDFRQMIRELQPKTRVFLSTINWWSCVDVKQFMEEAGDHAGEAETSAMMHLAPDLVRPLGEAGPGQRAAVAAHAAFAKAGRGRRDGGRRSPPTRASAIRRSRPPRRARRMSTRRSSGLRSFSSSSRALDLANLYE